MKAIVQDTYGSADVLEFRDIGTPEIAADEVLVRVHAAGVDRGVWHLMTGLPYPVRLAGYGLRAPKTPVPGTNMAGVVEAAGHEVTRFQPGDEVFGFGNGAFAERSSQGHPVPRAGTRPGKGRHHRLTPAKEPATPPCARFHKPSPRKRISPETRLERTVLPLRARLNWGASTSSSEHAPAGQPGRLRS